MDSGFVGLLANGGVPALIAGLLLGLKYGVEWWRSRRHAKRGGGAESGPTPLADAATTNALLLESLRSERAENRRKDARIDELEAEVADLREQLFTQAREYEAELSDLRSKVQEVTLQLEALQARIGATLNNTREG